MAAPWFDPLHFGVAYGVIGGGAGGVAGMLGALAGILAPRGIGRTWILGGFYVGFFLGIAQLLFGMCAWWMGQPWSIWYGPVLCGMIFIPVLGGLIPLVRKRYRQAEERRLEAEALRKS